MHLRLLQNHAYEELKFKQNRWFCPVFFSKCVCSQAIDKIKPELVSACCGTSDHPQRGKSHQFGGHALEVVLASSMKERLQTECNRETVMYKEKDWYLLPTKVRDDWPRESQQGRIFTHLLKHSKQWNNKII